MILSLKERIGRYCDQNKNANPLKYKEKYSSNLWSKTKYECFTCSYLSTIDYKILWDDNCNRPKIVPMKILQDDIRETPHHMYNIFRIIRTIKNLDIYASAESKRYNIKNRIRK